MGEVNKKSSGNFRSKMLPPKFGILAKTVIEEISSSARKLKY